MKIYDAIIIGGGPAGLASAIKLYDLGIENILIIEREQYLGGILNQCIHDGFGLKRFKKSLTGPEYAEIFINELNKRNINYVTNSMVIDIKNNKEVTISSIDGVYKVKSKAILLCMGCRERTREMLTIPGTRPSGVFTAGVAQSYINIHNRMIGKNIIILGSGDIGLIMARRLTLEGANVKMVLEINNHPSGLVRNIEQCLNDYNIPLYLNKTISYIHGKDRICGVTISDVDNNGVVIKNSNKFIECDTLVLSVGLIPENDLSENAGIILDAKTNGPIIDNNYETNINGIFASGNVLHVHDLVDNVSLESENMAKSVYNYIHELNSTSKLIEIKKNKNISYILPQKANLNYDINLSLRVNKPFKKAKIDIVQSNKVIKSLNYNKLIPAQMIQIKINKNDFISNDNLEVFII